MISSILKKSLFIITISIIIGLLVIISPSKSIVLVGGIITIIGLVIRNDFEKNLIIIFFFCLPFTIRYILNNNLINENRSVPILSAINLLDLLIIAFAILIIIEFRNREKTNITIKYTIILFGVYSVFSVFFALNKNAAIYGLMRNIKAIIIFIFFAYYFNIDKYLNTIIKIIGISINIQLVVALLQILNNGAIGLSFLGESSNVFRSGVNGFERGASGTFNHPNILAIYCAIMLPLFLFNKISSNKKNIMNVYFTVITLVTIIITNSRTAILLSIIIVTTWIISVLKRENFTVIKKVWIIYGILSIIIVSIVFMPSIYEKIINRIFYSDSISQISGRLEHSSSAFQYIKDRPWFGFGINNNIDVYKLYYPISYHNEFILQHPIHNTYLLNMVEIGLVGFLIFILFIIQNYIILLKIIRKRKFKYKGIGKSLMLSLIVFCIFYMTDWVGTTERFYYILFLFMGINTNIYISNRNIKLKIRVH